MERLRATRPVRTPAFRRAPDRIPRLAGPSGRRADGFAGRRGAAVRPVRAQAHRSARALHRPPLPVRSPALRRAPGWLPCPAGPSGRFAGRRGALVSPVRTPFPAAPRAGRRARRDSQAAESATLPDARCRRTSGAGAVAFRRASGWPPRPAGLSGRRVGGFAGRRGAAVRPVQALAHRSAMHRTGPRSRCGHQPSASPRTCRRAGRDLQAAKLAALADGEVLS